MNSFVEQVRPYFERALALYREHFWPLTRISLVPMLPVSVLSVVLDGIMGSSGLLGVFFGLLLTLFLLIPLLVVARVAAESLVIAQVDELEAGRSPLSLSGAWRKLDGRLGSFVFTGVLAALAVVVGLALFVLPGLFVAYRLFALTPVMVLERKSGIEALFRSSEVVRAASREFLAVFTVAGLASALGSYLLNALLPARLEPLAGPLAIGLVLPVPLVALTLLYRDVLARAVVFVESRSSKSGSEASETTTISAAVGR